ncbi:MAG: hypothetical protein HQK52_04165 [Oligoflexia bacterium]|nr:hypothetical protein [Oligoflexia bacterium]
MIQHPPHIHLLGNPLSNFNYLGDLDKNNIQSLIDAVQGYLKSGLWAIDQSIAKGLDFLAQKILKNNLLFPEYLNAYAEGLGLNPIEIIKQYLIIEALPSINKFIPLLPNLTLGCSSLFTYNAEENSLTHGRILDFPLTNNYLKGERSILYELSGHPKIWTLSLAGLPYPSLTSISEHGITLALHMKYGKNFNLKGHLIFELVMGLLFEAQDQASALKYLKGKSAIGNWGIYLGLPCGDVLAIDIYGEELFHKIYHMKEQKIIYFNNLPIKKEKLHENYSNGQENYCLMRKKSFSKKIAAFKKTFPGKIPDAIDVISLLGSPDLASTPIPAPTLVSTKNISEWNQDTLTLASLQIVTLNASKQQILYTPGSCPKITPNKLLQISNIWKQNGKREMIASNVKSDPRIAKYRNGMTRFSKAASFYDQKNYTEAFHHIQIAIELLDGLYEKNIATFYFLVFQYVHFKNKQDHLSLLPQFHSIKDKIPSYLREQALLFISRLEKLYFITPSVGIDDFSYSDLKNRYLFESKLPRFLLKEMRRLIFPQIGTIDVLYGYNVKK